MVAKTTADGGEQAENHIATTSEEIVDILDRLAGEGRVGVETGSRHAPTVVHLETPEGEFRFERPVDGATHEGADFTRHWYFGALRLSYSVDRTPGNETHTILVRDGRN